ncbi:MAG: ECF-type sigma factor, partial [Burkholderiaceae bacterium]
AMGDVTDLLRRAQGADPAAIDELVALLYPDLRRMARGKLAANDTITLLDTTSMVHEVYLKLHHAARIDADCRGQFMAYAAQAMRSVIVDFARKRRAERRGGGVADATLATAILDGSPSTDDDVERVDEALRELEKTDPRLKQVVEMRFFGGLTEPEIAEALGLTERTVRRDWERARLLLSVALRP